MDATLEAFHPGVSFRITFGDDATARADFTVYEDTPDEQVAPGLDDIESEADQALADALRELAHP